MYETSEEANISSDYHFYIETTLSVKLTEKTEDILMYTYSKIKKNAEKYHI